MAVPDFQSMMLPALSALRDQRALSVGDLRERVVASMKISDTDRAEKLPSGRQSRFDNRIAWVLVHLGFAGLISRPQRGFAEITVRGFEVLKSNPARIDLRFLAQFPEYQAARMRKRNGREEEDDSVGEIESASPDEVLEKSVGELHSALAAELLERIKANSPLFFERLVLDLMQRLGYGNKLLDWGEHLGRGGDRGLDGVIKEDRLGLDVIYLQAKRWDGPVGPATVREFLGALDQAGAKKGVLITTSTFTKEARLPSSRSDKKISLIDGLTLAELMIEHDVGVTTARTFHIKKIDLDYFEDA